MTLNRFLRPWNHEEVNGKLRTLYGSIQRCKRCDLGYIYPNTARILYGKLGRIPLLVVSQNPSIRWAVREPDLDHVHGNLERIDKYFDNVFTETLHKAGYGSYDDDYFYITNVVKCCTPENTPPENRHIVACSKYLQQEIAIISPKVIVCLGALAKRGVGNLKLPEIKIVYLKHPGAILSGKMALEFAEEFVKIIGEVVG